MTKRVRPFTRRVLQTIDRYQLLKEGDHILVALSGGPDSVALLLVLEELKERLALDLFAAHVNHQLRGEESQQDEQFVQDLCRELAIPIEIKRVDTRHAVRESGENLEGCARRLRYDFLFEVAQERNARVATGHTLNDQAETFLMKLIRGAGPAGLSGISPLRVNRIEVPSGSSSCVTVVRPLLQAGRQDVLGYLEDRNQTYRIDSSNEDLSLDRNWVRHQLIPLLEEKLNPALIETLQRSTELFSEVEEFLAQQGKEAFGRCRSGEDPVSLRISVLGGLPAIIQKEVIRQAIASTKGDLRDINLRHVGEVLQLSRISSGKEIHLPGGLRAQREFEDLRFTVEPPPGPFSYPLRVPGEVYIMETSQGVVARRAGKEEEKEKEEEERGQTVWIKWSGDSLTVRNRRPGDLYRVSSKSGEKKLKELFQRERIPKSQRDRLVVIEGDDDIIWVEGFPVQPAYRASPSTAGALEIRLLHETSGARRPLKE